MANATPQDFSQPLREGRHYSREERKDAERKYEQWEEYEYAMSIGLYEMDDQELAEYKQSDDYKEELKKIAEKRKEMEEQYGPDFTFSNKWKW